MKCSTWKLYFALRDANVDIGDTIEISHPDKGEYVIRKVGKETQDSLGWEE